MDKQALTKWLYEQFRDTDVNLSGYVDDRSLSHNRYDEVLLDGRFDLEKLAENILALGKTNG